MGADGREHVNIRFRQNAGSLDSADSQNLDGLIIAGEEARVIFSRDDLSTESLEETFNERHPGWAETMIEQIALQAPDNPYDALFFAQREIRALSSGLSEGSITRLSESVIRQMTDLPGYDEWCTTMDVEGESTTFSEECSSIADLWEGGPTVTGSSPDRELPPPNGKKFTAKSGFAKSQACVKPSLDSLVREILATTDAGDHAYQRISMLVDRHIDGALEKAGSLRKVIKGLCGFLVAEQAVVQRLSMITDHASNIRPKIVRHVATCLMIRSFLSRFFDNLRPLDRKLSLAGLWISAFGNEVRNTTDLKKLKASTALFTTWTREHVHCIVDELNVIQKNAAVDASMFSQNSFAATAKRIASDAFAGEDFDQDMRDLTTRLVNDGRVEAPRQLSPPELIQVMCGINSDFRATKEMVVSLIRKLANPMMKMMEAIKTRAIDGEGHIFKKIAKAAQASSDAARLSHGTDLQAWNQASDAINSAVIALMNKQSSFDDRVPRDYTAAALTISLLASSAHRVLLPAAAKTARSCISFAISANRRDAREDRTAALTQINARLRGVDSRRADPSQLRKVVAASSKSYKAALLCAQLSDLAEESVAVFTPRQNDENVTHLIEAARYASLYQTAIDSQVTAQAMDKFVCSLIDTHGDSLAKFIGLDIASQSLEHNLFRRSRGSLILISRRHSILKNMRDMGLMSL